MKRKSESAAIYTKFLGQIRAWAPAIEAKTGFSIQGIAELFTDRGGEFTTPFGGTRNVLDELAMDIKHTLNTPDTPQSGTTKIRASVGHAACGGESSHMLQWFGQQVFLGCICAGG